MHLAQHFLRPPIAVGLLKQRLLRERAPRWRPDMQQAQTDVQDDGLHTDSKDLEEKNDVSHFTEILCWVDGKISHERGVEPGLTLGVEQFGGWSG